MSESRIKIPQSAIRNTKLVLIVDDDPDDIEITRRVLARCGRDVTIRAAASGEEAMQLLEREAELPAVIFLDLKMQGMSGIDTVRRIRADDRLRHIPMIIVTNSTLESDMRKAYEAGVDCYIHKAFDIDQFSRDIKANLDCWLE